MSVGGVSKDEHLFKIFKLFIINIKALPQDFGCKPKAHVTKLR